MRYKRLLISPGELFKLLHADYRFRSYGVISDAVPKDARLVNVRHGWPNVIEILIESAEFEEVQEGSEIPALCPVLRRVASGQESVRALEEAV